MNLEKFADESVSSTTDKCIFETIKSEILRKNKELVLGLAQWVYTKSFKEFSVL